MESKDEQLEKILKMVEENNRILKGMRRNHTISSVMRLIYIGLFIYASYWSYEQLKPYLKQMITLTQQVSDLSNKTSEAKETLSPELLKLLDKLPK